MRDNAMIMLEFWTKKKGCISNISKILIRVLIKEQDNISITF
jgi:hypothetical protein